jgi:hypothetical protein
MVEAMTTQPDQQIRAQPAALSAVWGDVLAAVVPPFLISRGFILLLALILTDGLAGGVWPLPPSVHPGTLSPLSNAWDAGWYISIARDGYDPSATEGVQHNYAFFPLLPLLMRLLAGAARPPSDYGLAGVLISHLAFFGALVVLYRLTVAVFRDRAMGRRTCWILALAPWGFVFSMAYTEALFLLLSSAAIWCAWRAAYTLNSAGAGRVWMGVALACVAGAALTRPPGVLVAIGVAWLLARRAAVPTVRRRALLVAAPLFVAVAGFLGFVLYIGELTGSAGAALQAARGWGAGFWPDLQERLGSGDALTWLYAVIQVAFLIAWVALTVGLWRLRGVDRVRGAVAPGQPLPAAPGFGGFRLYGLALLGTLAQVPAALSLARYALASFPCAWVLARLPVPRPIGWALLLASLLVQGLFFWLAGTVSWPP